MRMTRLAEPTIVPRRVGAMSTAQASLEASGILEKMEETRSKCSNIKGEISGKWKRQIVRLEEIAFYLAYCAETTGDPHFLRIKNKELWDEVARLSGENESLKSRIEALEKRVGALGPDTSDTGVRRPELGRESLETNTLRGGRGPRAREPAGGARDLENKEQAPNGQD